MSAMRFSPFHASNKLPKLFQLTKLSTICALLCYVVSAEAGKCNGDYCSRFGLQNLYGNCCTFGSALECGCCLPDKNKNPSSGCNSSNEYPTWESCVNDWNGGCCVNGWRPMYYGVDWVSDASCCVLCNGGNWGITTSVKEVCVQDTVPKLLCNSEHEGSNTMLRHEVMTEE
eukprot:2685396-Ditylum_brightwellii.AAC.1